MTEQYFTAEPTSESRPAPCSFPYRGHGLNFETDAGVFSRGELDPGTRLLLDALPEFAGSVLDLGCGWGPIAVAVAKANPTCQVTAADINQRALRLCAENARRNGVTINCITSDGLSAFAGKSFQLIVTNPPIRAGKQVIYRMFADAAAHLCPGGALYLVIRKQQGAESCLKYLKTLYRTVEKVSKSAGYWVLKAAEPLEQAAKEE